MIGVQSTDGGRILDGLFDNDLIRLSRLIINENLSQQRRYLLRFTLQLSDALLVQSKSANGLGRSCSGYGRRCLR
ncbi:hypothetical protein D9M68_865460 [compost metagenome]